jgi:predicted ATPase
MLEVRLLGNFDVRRDGKPFAITSRPAQSLFAYLVLNAGTAHRREKLAGMLWPDSLEETARDNLRHSLWRVRKALAQQPTNEYLLTDDMSISFNASADYWLDAAELERVSESTSADALMPVLSAYQGELLPGFYDEWVVLEREHLQSVFEHKMARLLALLQDENRWLETLDWGERWIKLGQKPEPAYRALMSAHAAKGDMSKVAATYERCAKSLREFGIEPSEQTKELYENLKSGKVAPGNLPAPTKLAARGASANIPVPLTSFVGREKELNEIARLLSSSRLLTLTGPGGVGKTRLAIQTAQSSGKKFRDGVFWVGLVGLSDANLIPQEIAESLNVREVPNEALIETLETHLESKEALLVIDNCEHLIRACAQYAEQLLSACPKLKILATSIEGLGIFNETSWQVPSLPLPEMQQLSLAELQEFASIELFVQRASTAKNGFTLTDQNATSVAQICQRLDGIPLAIELAAARIKVLSAAEIAARLDDRFSLLTAGSRTAIPRHQTLRAAIDWSYDLLTEPERMLFRRLSVFAGGFTLEAAEAICSQGESKRTGVLDLLGRLVDKSLVIVETASPTGGTRFRLLETIRQYALEKLAEVGEAREIRDRHLDFFVDLAEQAEAHIFGGESAVWFKRLDHELDNVRAAIEWSTNSGKAVAALQIVGALVYFWFARGLLASEWSDHAQRALSRPEGMKRTLARAKALNGIGFMYWADIYPTDKRSELEEALNIGIEVGDPWNIATALRNLGLTDSIQGNYERAQTLLEQSLAIWRDMGPAGKNGSGWTLIYLGDGALIQARSEVARSYYEEAKTFLLEIRDVNFLAYLIRRLGQLALRDGDIGNAIALCAESLQMNQEVSDTRGLVACLAGFAAIAVAQGRFERAAQLMGSVETQLGSTGIQLLYVDKIEFEHNLARLRRELDEATLALFWVKGRGMSLDQTLALALEPS